VPSVLVYTKPERIPAAAEPWTLRRGDVIAYELVRPPDWTLYIATVRDARVVIVGYAEELAVDHEELGVATRCDVDITPVIDRLGCERVESFASWAATPVVLTKNDADLLRYRLGLPLDPIIPPLQPPPPEPHQAPTGFIDDVTALRLLGLVYGDTTSDTHRMVLADRLLELGDPRGELIALQLARAKSGSEVTQRERELLARYGTIWTQPLGTYLKRYEFRRGFLASAVLDHRTDFPAELERQSMWTTVEDLETINASLIRSSALASLRRLATTCDVLARVAREQRPLGVETVVGVTTDVAGHRIQGGLELTDIAPLIESHAFEKLRSMCISVLTPAHRRRAYRLLRSGLGTRLQHVELFILDVQQEPIAPWFDLYERNRPLSFGVRSVLHGWVVVLVRQRSSLTLQLGDPMTASMPDVALLMPAITALAGGLDCVAVEAVGNDGLDLQPVVEQLRGTFRRSRLVPPRQRWRSP